jgi:hypothetical protein
VDSLGFKDVEGATLVGPFGSSGGRRGSLRNPLVTSMVDHTSMVNHAKIP